MFSQTLSVSWKVCMASGKGSGIRHWKFGKGRQNCGKFVYYSNFSHDLRRAWLSGRWVMPIMTSFVTGSQFIQPHTLHGMPSGPKSACARCFCCNTHARAQWEWPYRAAGCDAKQRCHALFLIASTVFVLKYITLLVTLSLMMPVAKSRWLWASWRNQWLRQWMMLRCWVSSTVDSL